MVVIRLSLSLAGLVFAATLSVALPALAQEITACAEAGGTQNDINICYRDQYQASDRVLNERYSEIERRLADDPETKQLLVDAQRAWIGFRDAECTFGASAVAQGSIYPTIRYLCLQSLTEARITDFDRYLACEEGDLSCPVPAVAE